MSSEAWELVDAVEGVIDGSQQVHLCARQKRLVSNWSRIVSVARHYYRLRHLMGIIGWCLKENKQFARDELFDEFPEVDPKRVEREAKAKAKAERRAKAKAKAAQRKCSPHPKSIEKEASVVNKSRGRSTIKQCLHQSKRGTSTDSGISKRGSSTDSDEKVVSRSSKQVAVAKSSVPSVVIADIESGHYKGTHWYKGKRVGVDSEIENSHYQ